MAIVAVRKSAVRTPFNGVLRVYRGYSSSDLGTLDPGHVTSGRQDKIWVDRSFQLAGKSGESRVTGIQDAHCVDVETVGQETFFLPCLEKCSVTVIGPCCRIRVPAIKKQGNSRVEAAIVYCRQCDERIDAVLRANAFNHVGIAANVFSPYRNQRRKPYEPTAIACGVLVARVLAKSLIANRPATTRHHWGAMHDLQCPESVSAMPFTRVASLPGSTRAMFRARPTFRRLIK